MKDFYGLPVQEISNGSLRAVCLAETGPRIVGLFAESLPGNLLAETPQAYQDTPAGRYLLHGGHRLWEAPEVVGVTGLPEGEVSLNILDAGLRIQGAPNPLGLQKTMEIEFTAPRSLRIRHHIANLDMQDFHLAAWGITQLQPGCTVLVPQPARPAEQAKMPDRNIVLWPYSIWPPDAISFNEHGLHFDPAAVQPPFKFGTYAPAGWARAVYESYTFTKRFSAQLDAHYPDYGCNLEIYVGEGYVEIESLSPLTSLPPGATLSHEEIWEIELA